MSVPANHPTVEAMFDQHAPGIRRLLIHRIGDENSADDVLQMTFLKLNEHLESIEPVAIRAWLYRVAINQANMLGRKKQLDAKARERLLDMKTMTEESPEKTVLRKERIEFARRLLDGLPEKQQIIVRLKFYQGLTFAEIASQLETPLGTVLSRMRSAMKTLAQIGRRTDLETESFHE